MSVDIDLDEAFRSQAEVEKPFKTYFNADDGFFYLAMLDPSTPVRIRGIRVDLDGNGNKEITIKL